MRLGRPQWRAKHPQAALTRQPSVPRSRAGAVGHRLGSSALRPRATAKEAGAKESTDGAEEETFDGRDDGIGLTTQQVHTMLHTICEDTAIAQVQLKMGSFSLNVKRSAAKNGSTPLPSSFYAVGNSTGPVIPIPPSGTAFQSTASMDFPDMTLSGAGTAGGTLGTQSQSVDEEEEEEGHLFLESPKVGFMRRGRYVKGKKVGKGLMAEEGDKVKKGQVLGFVEQLGTFVPFEATQAGELVAFLADEGQAVEYKQEIVEIAPFFGGHIIGDRKNA